jgi:2'-hydroxyisoflavone reductase
VPAGEPLQFIDVRDLGEWMVALVEQGASGAFNATGPVHAPVCDWNELVTSCAAEAAARGVTPASAARVGEAFLTQHGVQPWTELPLWLPSDDANYRGFSRVDLTRAIAAGLRTRPLRETIGAVMEEGVPAPDDKRRAGRLTRQREAELLSAWSHR